MQSNVEVTLRISRVQPSFIKGSVRFSGVPVNKTTFSKVSAIDLYFVAISDDSIPLEPTEGQVWHLKGKSTTEEKPSHDKKYIHRHHFISEVSEANFVFPLVNQAFVEFITNDKAFKGIGRSVAIKIWSAFGNRIFSLLENNNQDALSTVLTDLQIKNMSAGYKRYGNLKYAEYLTSKNIPLPVQKRIFKFTNYDRSNVSHMSVKGNTANDPIQIIENNPYIITNFGLSFEKADKIAKTHFFINDDDPRRLVSALQIAIKKHEEKGHTIASDKDLRHYLKKMLENNDYVKKAFSEAIDRRFFIFNESHSFYQSLPSYLMENVVAKRLLKLHRKGNKFDEAESQACIKALKLSPYELLQQQKNAVLAAVGSSISCIVGGAGTGKTTVLKTVVNAYKSLGYNIFAMALSGRAAMRMHESINIPTSTIAKFLKEDPIENDSVKTIIIIDESSMLDLVTLYRIVTHVHPSVRFLLVGDQYQLPSIGSGNVLADIVKSNTISVTELDIVKRSDASTGIPEYTKKIREGICPEDLTHGNIIFHDTEYKNVDRICTQLYKDNSRIICPTNSLVDEINTLCQKQYNAEGEQLKFIDDEGQYLHHKLFLNDPVLFTQNNYDAGVQNGTLGYLTDVQQSDQHYGTVHVDKGDDIKLTMALLLNIKAGYALTLHKAQGSQFPEVIIGLTNGSNLDRAWLYTAITRAEAIVHIVGPREKMLSAITNVSNASKRNTHLSQLLITGDAVR